MAHIELSTAEAWTLDAALGVYVEYMNNAAQLSQHEGVEAAAELFIKTSHQAQRLRDRLDAEALYV